MKNAILKTGISKASAAVFTILLLLSATSCRDYFEDELYNKYNLDDYFANVERLDMAVLSVYATQQSRYTCGQSWLAFDCDTDITNIRGSEINTSNPYRDIGHYNIMLGAEMIEKAWKVLYEGIGRANTVIDNYTKVPADTDAEKQTVRKLVAEAKFLRGMSYFDLVRLYGDVPLTLKTTELTDDFLLPRTEKETVYDQIIRDIEEAIPDLPWHDDKAFTYNYRVTKGGAMGVLARVWLYRAGYSLHQDGVMRQPANALDYHQKVLDVTNDIITSGKHQLNPDYETIFRNVCNNIAEPKEVMLEIDFVNQPGYDDIEGYIGSWNALITAFIPNVISRANCFVRTQYMYYSKFEDNDLRRDVTVGTYQVKNDNGAAVQAPIPERNSQDWGIGKWRREWQENLQMQLADLGRTDLNYMVIRYADVLLMRAESLNEINNGPTAEAIELVNQVRRRGYGQDINTPDPTVDMPASITSKEDFLSFLQDERAREFGAESMIRRMDLIRWDILGDKIKETYDFCVANEPLEYDAKGNPIEFPTFPRYITFHYTAYDQFKKNCHELYPIPLREMNQNPNLIQNPGYKQ